MRRNNKKGFTIVELVIVIAAIAILTAVMIPTFSAISKKAQISADTQVVRNLNTALVAGSATGKPATMYEALQFAKEAGYDVKKLNAKANGNEILWDSVNNAYCYFNGDKISYEYVGIAKKDKVEDWQYWVIDNKISPKYSTYYTGSDTEIVTTKGFDAGENTNITAVNYTNTGAAQDVVIRTNGGKLTINAPQDTVYHYNNLDTLEVQAIKNASYHEIGAVVNQATLKVGRIVVEKGAYINEIKLDETATSDTAAIKVDGYVKKVDSSAITDTTKLVVATGTGYVADNNGEVLGTADAVTTTISSAADLLQFRDRVNAGQDYSGLTIKLAADIDLSNVTWAPIGTWFNPFHGTIDGNGHTITGLGSQVDLSEAYTKDYYTEGQSTHITGYAYGFIGIAGNGDVTIQNINFKDVNINLASGNMVAAVIGWAPKNERFTDATKAAGIEIANYWAGNTEVGKHDVTISNITVSGTITADQDAAGIAGKLYNEGKQTISNCTVDATITSAKSRAAGIVAMVNGSQEILIENCVNKKAVTATTYVGGILGYASGCKGTIKGCSNEGTLSGTQSHDIWKTTSGKGNLTIQ